MAVGAKEPLINASIVIDGVDLSQVANQVQIEDSAQEHDVSSFQGGGYTEETFGLKTAVINITFWQDYETGSVHDTLAPIYRDNEAVVVDIKADDEAVSATNPLWRMTGKLGTYNPIDAEVGNPQSIQVTFRNASSAGLVEHTTDPGSGSGSGA